ncbi:hypothetical protein Mpsy_2585 [Methanolobus psychrophilus R15]|nr:hypothetical protein Mpsy_2585 [Methanolobus psychrophilus R15]
MELYFRDRRDCTYSRGYQQYDYDSHDVLPALLMLYQGKVCISAKIIAKFLDSHLV